MPVSAFQYDLASKTHGRPSFIIPNSSFDIPQRPYQVYAVKQMVKCIEDDAGNGYVWHTTGSGKTLTSFNASTLLKENDHIHKCVFMVDRKERGEANISRDIGGRVTGQFQARRFISSN